MTPPMTDAVDVETLLAKMIWSGEADCPTPFDNACVTRADIAEIIWAAKHEAYLAAAVRADQILRDLPKPQPVDGDDPIVRARFHGRQEVIDFVSPLIEGMRASVNVMELERRELQAQHASRTQSQHVN
jgi:hypothetical protein